MTFLAFAFLIPAIICLWLTNYFIEECNEYLGFASLIFCATFLVLSIVIPIAEFQSKKKAEFYNANFGTHYTANDFFWYSEEIENMLIGKKVRVENGKQ